MLLSDVDRGQRGQAVTASSVLIIFPRPGWQPHQGWQTTHQILHQAKLSDFVNLKRLLRHGDFDLLFIRENICSGGDSWQLVPVTAAWRL